MEWTMLTYLTWRLLDEQLIEITYAEYNRAWLLESASGSQVINDTMHHRSQSILMALLTARVFSM